MEKDKNGVISRLLKKIPLSTEIRVGNQMAFINLIHELGYRENKYWTEEDNDLFQKIIDLADKHTKDQLKDIKKYMKKNNNEFFNKHLNIL